VKGESLAPTLSEVDRQKEEAARKKATALAALDEADRLLRFARGELSMLEGPYYNNHSAELRDLRISVDRFIARLRRLQPPTGIFEY
jgi:hypothetical protein